MSAADVAGMLRKGNDGSMWRSSQCGSVYRWKPSAASVTKKVHMTKQRSRECAREMKSKMKARNKLTKSIKYEGYTDTKVPIEMQQAYMRARRNMRTNKKIKGERRDMPFEKDGGYSGLKYEGYTNTKVPIEVQQAYMRTRRSRSKKKKAS
jgi:hypothetical protein